MILTDDLGWADIGSQGINKDIRTPNVDALAAGGLRATNGYVTAPQCVPSRAGLLTGRYQPRSGVKSNGSELNGFDTQQPIASRLKKAGYATGVTGKWHLGPASKFKRDKDICQIHFARVSDRSGYVLVPFELSSGSACP